MTTTHQVTCIIPDGADADRRIDSIGGTGGGSWQLPLDDAIAGIESAKLAFYVNVRGHRDDVIVALRRNGRKYLKTRGDGVEPNNLLALPRCS
jgi:hypothetical protein